MTMKEKLEVHRQIERENKRKLKAWKDDQPRSYYTLEYLDGSEWRLGTWRVSYGRIKVRMLEAAYKMGGFETRVIKETF